MGDTIDRTALISALSRPEAYPHAVGSIEHLETHISDLLLTGHYAYKLKKPLDLGFLDFSTLERRRRCCEEELRLNRRLAPELYLAVVPIGMSAGQPRVGGDGPAIEYAVQMRQFDQSGLLERVAARGELRAPIVDAIADQVAEFHSTLAPAPAESGYGAATEIVAPALQNFEQLLPLVAGAAATSLRNLRAWTERRARELEARFEARRRDGFVRECHGDLHLGNIVLVDGRVRIFDCIEFNPHLRWIDVVSEVAFLTMDLIQRGCAGLSYRFVNRYLERTSDYAGLDLLSYYMVYRALVRAKVAAIRAAQGDLDADTRSRLREKCRAHIELAERLTGERPRALFIMHGFSGSGKTVLSQALLETLGAIRVRSDVERKRLHGLSAEARTRPQLGEGIYAAAASEATYERLAELAGRILDAGFPAVADATFLEWRRREQFRAAAAARGAAFSILDVRASERTLRERIARRAAAAADASEADERVLDRQLAAQEPLTDSELKHTCAFDSERLGPEEMAASLREIVRQLSEAGPARESAS